MLSFNSGYALASTEFGSATTSSCRTTSICLPASGPESITVSAWMKSLKNAISKTLRNATFHGPHWQKGFFDHVIRSQEFYDQKWFYVRDNPVRAGLVQSAEDWPYTGQICNLPL